MKLVYTVEDCIAYKATANCGVWETKQNQKRCGKVYNGCLLFSFKTLKLNYNAYNQGIRKLHILPNLCEWVPEHTLL